MAFTEDVDAFFGTDDFAVEALYKALGTGSGVTIKVIFDAPGIDHLGISGINPSVLVAADDVASFSNADTLTIGDKVYRCVNSDPQDDGALVRVQLERRP